MEKELHCVFVDLEKAYGRVLKKKGLWSCMRKTREAERFVKLVLKL